MKVYIHQSSCISPQDTFGEMDLNTLHLSANNWLTSLEPNYEGIPRGVLRRMGKAVRIGVGAALPLISKDKPLAGIILGTANGGMEDCVRFFNQIIDYDEGNLTPTNFVQSTTNAIASQIGLMAGNRGYNGTHVHAGLAFENAVLDAFMQLQQDTGKTYLVGGVEEISDYNFNIDYLQGWIKKETVSNSELFDSVTDGSIAGEGAAMFLLSGNPRGAQSCLSGLSTISTDDLKEVDGWIDDFLKTHFTDEGSPGLILTGENGDPRELPFYQALESKLPERALARYKHFTGEYPTANAVGLWFANHILETGRIPDLMVKSGSAQTPEKILLYNCYHQSQHSLMVLEKV